MIETAAMRTLFEPMPFGDSSPFNSRRWQEGIEGLIEKVKGAVKKSSGLVGDMIWAHVKMESVNIYGRCPIHFRRCGCGEQKPVIKPPSGSGKLALDHLK